MNSWRITPLWKQSCSRIGMRRLYNDFFAMIFHGTLRKLTQKWCGDTSGMLANDAIRGQAA